ncbi:hypothetical protein XM38_039920 [Halomicronema hongdechloris C2206]|uniref:Uncharacterized protein n=1 Tax=Halomicronema hongdechloris C2206 TaxID=1641165 RepID=A0A1Z3HRT8_9CYAN|nr:hypothetical protein [Halomicronema hongdechloris]ASC73030.1 hypothetical protein XM38_039920 [Halomicronema hongdechloris C2206]
MIPPDGRHLSFPFRIAADGRTAQVDTLEQHVRDELIQLILTNPGERLFLPELGRGCGGWCLRMPERLRQQRPKPP